jgi:hypothetical protein
MQPLSVESRFCRFEAPWNWTLAPGLGAFHDRKAGDKRSALATENWMEKPITAAAYAEAQRALLAAQNPAVELFEQKPIVSSELGDAHLASFRLPGENQARFRQEQLTVANGPLLCCLTLTANESDREAWEEIFPAVLRSFEIPARTWAATIRREPLMANAAQPATGSAENLQLAFPPRPGWTFDAERGVLRGNAESEISLRRTGLTSDAPDALFAEALARVGKTSTHVPRAWDKGVTPGGFPFYILESTSVIRKTWGPLETLVLREAFLRDEAALEIRLQCRDGDTEAVTAFGELVSSYTLLPPEQRKLRIQLPWIDLQLAGPWTEAAPGVFVRQLDSVLFLTVRSLPNTQGRLRHGKSAVERFRARPDLREISKEESAEGPWKGWDAYRHSLDWSDAKERAGAYRASWLEMGKDLNEITLLGPATPETEEIFRQALQAVSGRS